MNMMKVFYAQEIKFITTIRYLLLFYSDSDISHDNMASHSVFTSTLKYSYLCDVFSRNIHI